METGTLVTMPRFAKADGPGCWWAVLHFMFGGKPKPIEQTTAKDIWFSAFFGTLIGGGILVSSFFGKEPEWFSWFIRCFCAIWLIGWWRSIFRWRRHLAEYQRQKRNH